MVLGLCVSLLSYLALLSNALSDHDFFAGDKCQQQGADQNPDQNDLLVKIDTGCVEGTRLSGTRIFRGIPYASPPVGNLRWRPPQPHKPWVSTLNAANFRSTCFQSVWRENKSLPVEGMWPSIQGVTNMSEVSFRPKQIPPAPIILSMPRGNNKAQTSCLLAGLFVAYFFVVVLMCSFCLYRTAFS